MKLKPDFADALFNRGLVLNELKRFSEALDTFDRLLVLNPGDAQALTHRGNALSELKKSDAALASYARALQLDPALLDALYNQGVALQELKRPEEAARSFAKLVALAPGYDFAKGRLLHARMLSCDWSELQELSAAIDSAIDAGRKAAEPFDYLATAQSARRLQQCAEIYASQYAVKASSIASDGHINANDKIRIGYVSGEFRQQATSILLVELFERHDRSKFDLIAFDNGWDDKSEIRLRIDKAFREVVDISRLSDAEAAAAIKSRNIDILVDLNGYFGRPRPEVFALKPSPIQVNYLGFPGTLGAGHVDYILADRHVIPERDKGFYTEKVVYLPDTYQANDTHRRISPVVPSRREAAIPEEAFVFCCFNNSFKITPEVFDVWMRLLQGVHGSVMWLLEDHAAVSRNLRREAERRSVAPERLVFASRLNPPEHLARHRLADLFLDTVPCNAHTTASDALWAGLPVLTCMGATFPGRVAGSLLHAIGLPELVTQSLKEYEALALKLALTPDLLSDIKHRLMKNRETHPLFDIDRFCRHMESACVTMWERHLRGEPKESFAVAAIDCRA